MILVDSSVWIDYFRGTSTPQTDALDSALGREPLVIGDLILTEVLQGFDGDKDFKEAGRRLSVLHQVEIGGFDVALQAAKNFRSLRSKGVTIRKTIGTLIATRCIADDLSLLYSDRDFDPFVTYLGLKSTLPVP